MALLIGVGGSGQHVALAASRLVYLGAMEPLDAVIVDSDAGEELTVGLVTFGGTCDDNRAQHPFRSLEVVEPLPEGIPTDRRFEELFQRHDGTQAHKELFDSFFDEDAARIEVHHGMYGNPAVGATVFAHAAGERLQRLVAMAGTADRIFVTGSFVGGTGAGVIHKEGYQAKTWLVALLPWQKPGDVARDAMPVNPASMLKNMHYGCDYLYRTSRRYVRGSCLLGIPSDGASGIGPALIEVGKNREYPHRLHAAACYYFQSAPEEAVLTRNEGDVFTYLHDHDRPLWLRDQTWRAKTSLTAYLRSAVWVDAVLDFLRDPKTRSEFSKTDNLLGGPKKDHYNRALYDTIKANVTKDGFKALAEQVWSAFDVEARRTDFVLDWAKELFGDLPRHPRINDFNANPLEYTRKACGAPLMQDANIRRSPQEIASYFVTQFRNYFLSLD